ncbi:MAG: sodium:solute symporter [Bacteroidia bacterium]|nr:sodium:solute symporter [Bacteroidia bacterium]
MSPIIIIFIILAYFGCLLWISWHTSKKATSEDFYAGNKQSLWYVVALGMVGTSLSGITFVSIPGTIGTAGFSYFQVVIGYFIGYFVVAYVLLPLYYRLNLTSIYSYLNKRFGINSYKSGASFFIISRVLGATLRLYLVINVLQYFVLEDIGFKFWHTAVIILAMILLYTLKGGVKTIVWTDTLQTIFMLTALIVCICYILSYLNLNITETFEKLESENLTLIFESDWLHKKYFLKQILGGAFVTITMTGLDQEMMQKNISVRTLKDSQKNMVSFSFILVFVNFMFLVLGGLLYLFAKSKNLVLPGDDLFPSIALQHLPPVVSLIFIIGLISALFPSADGAITALTSSFCIDILGIRNEGRYSEKEQSKIRMKVHLSFAVVFLLFVFFFKALGDKSVIDVLLDIAGYTYGPLLGLFSFGILTNRSVKDKFVPLICIIAPIFSYLLYLLFKHFKIEYQFGLEMLIINGTLTFLGLLLVSNPHKSNNINDDQSF